MLSKMLPYTFYILLVHQRILYHCVFYVIYNGYYSPFGGSVYK